MVTHLCTDPGRCRATFLTCPITLQLSQTATVACIIYYHMMIYVAMKLVWPARLLTECAIRIHILLTYLLTYLISSNNKNRNKHLLPRLSQNVRGFVNDNGFELRKLSRHVIGCEDEGSQPEWHSSNIVSIFAVDSRTSEHNPPQFAITKFWLGLTISGVSKTRIKSMWFKLRFK